MNHYLWQLSLPFTSLNIHHNNNNHKHNHQKHHHCHHCLFGFQYGWSCFFGHTRITYIHISTCLHHVSRSVSFTRQKNFTYMFVLSHSLGLTQITFRVIVALLSLPSPTSLFVYSFVQFLFRHTHTHIAKKPRREKKISRATNIYSIQTQKLQQIFVAITI